MISFSFAWKRKPGQHPDPERRLADAACCRWVPSVTISTTLLTGASVPVIFDNSD